ncbi:hypothetical protein [Apibacter muscae]|nr:hypothetical protein [Apibacter muscae]
MEIWLYKAAQAGGKYWCPSPIPQQVSTCWGLSPLISEPCTITVSDPT